MRLSISLEGELKPSVLARAKDLGFESVSAYFAALARNDLLRPNHDLVLYSAARTEQQRARAGKRSPANTAAKK